MIEFSPRPPHYRRYWAIKDGEDAYVTFSVDELGVVQVSEEVLNQLLTELGFEEIEL